MIEGILQDGISPLFIPTMISNIAAGHIAILNNAQGRCLDIVTACATSTNAMGEAFRAIRNGYADAIITGGCENATIPIGIVGFANAKALSRATDPTTPHFLSTATAPVLSWLTVPQRLS